MKALYGLVCDGMDAVEARLHAGLLQPIESLWNPLSDLDLQLGPDDGMA